MISGGADHVVDTLDALGVEVVFGLPGVHNLPLWESLAGTDIRVIGVRHEQTAGYAADGYARATGKLGVALVNAGAGAANTLGAVGEAMASASPVLVIVTGSPSTPHRHGVARGALHEVSDQQAMFAPVTKGGFTVERPEDLVGLVHRAGRLALEPQSGPVYLGVPTGFLRERAAPASWEPPTVQVPGPVPPADLAKAADLLGDAKRPLIWAGGGALRAGAGQAVGELARRLAAPVVTTFAARGLLPLDHPCLAPNPVRTPEVGELWDEADVVLAVGADFDGPMTQNWPMQRPPKLVAVSIDPADAAKDHPPDVLLVGDEREVVERLKVPVRSGLPALTERLASIGEAVRKRLRHEEPQAADLLATFEEVLPANATIVCDTCVAGYWVGGFHRVPAPRALAYPTGCGTLGFGFPAALGASLAGRGRTICVSGDGGFLHACGDLSTLAQEELPVTVIIVDDGGYGMLRSGQEREGLPHRGVDLDSPDFVGLARSFGVHAERVSGFGRAFRRLLGEFVDAGEPNVLVVRAKLAPPPNTSRQG